MKLSVIVIAYEMAREIPRTLLSLSRSYQLNTAGLDYEVLLVDNGSPTPLDPASWADIDVPVRLLRIEQAHPSPASAINLAAAEAEGEVLCLMIDGAHLLTPAVFQVALSCFAAFTSPVVATRYFFLGPEEQNLSIQDGYSQEVEDRLLEDIQWPADGYRLFEIGTPFWAGANRVTWFNRMFESNCLFLSARLFRDIGGAEERFDYPGGGFLNLDLHKRAADHPGATPVQLVGEGSFHQLHGGTTTNVSMDTRKAQTRKYRAQYEAIRGHGELMTAKDVFYLGHLPTQASKIHLRERAPGH